MYTYSLQTNYFYYCCIYVHPIMHEHHIDYSNVMIGRVTTHYISPVGVTVVGTEKNNSNTALS